MSTNNIFITPNNMREKSVRQKGFQITGKDAPKRATRLEGKVKNKGIQNVRKKGKRSK